MKKLLIIVFMYIAAIVGAGFATGSEIIYYFVRFGRPSYLGIMLTSVGFGIVSSTVLLFCKNNGATDFDDFCIKLFGKNKFVAKLIIYVFSMLVLGAMIRAFADILGNILGINKSFFAFFFGLMCFILMLLPSNRVINIGGYLGVIITISIIICAVFMLKNRYINAFSNNTQIIDSAVTYTTYNTIAVIPILCEANNRLIGRKECILVGIISTILMLLIMSLLWGLISVYFGKISLDAMPLLTLAKRQGNAFYLVYLGVVIIAIITSAISAEYSLTRINKRLFSKPLNEAFSTSLGMLVASFEFTSIVDKLYRGLGQIVLVLILIFFVKNMIKRVNKRKTKKKSEFKA